MTVLQVWECIPSISDAFIFSVSFADSYYFLRCGGAALAYSDSSCWNTPRASQVRAKTKRGGGGRHIRCSLGNVLEGKHFLHYWIFFSFPYESTFAWLSRADRHVVRVLPPVAQSESENQIIYHPGLEKKYFFGFWFRILKNCSAFRKSTCLNKTFLKWIGTSFWEFIGKTGGSALSSFWIVLKASHALSLLFLLVTGWAASCWRSAVVGYSVPCALLWLRCSRRQEVHNLGFDCLHSHSCSGHHSAASTWVSWVLPGFSCFG